MEKHNNGQPTAQWGTLHIFPQTDISLTSSTSAGTSKSALKAHKVVLSASSQYFRDQLQVSLMNEDHYLLLNCCHFVNFSFILVTTVAGTKTT